MDLDKLYSSKHWLEYSSFTLNTENFVILSNSMLVLQNDNHFKKIFFWGIIQCLDTDYCIVYGYKEDAIVGKTFFYSEDCQNWKLLPVPNQKHLILTELCKQPFQGDPSLVIEVVDDAPLEKLFPDDKENQSILETSNSSLDKQPKESEFDEQKKQESISSLVKEDESEAPITSGELKEEDRLAAIVHIITDETSIIPRGALFKQTDGVHIHSQAFEGLSLDDADVLSSFQHYRVPQQDWNTNLLTRVDYNYAKDFLDTIDKDVPSDCWAAQLVEGDRTIILRNLAWPGFMFYHHLHTPDHGYIYVGKGQRNLDIPFMTQVRYPSDEAAMPIQSVQSLTTLSKTQSRKISLTKKEDVIEPEKQQEEVDDQTPEFESEIITSA